jgi:hypothetical protein
MRSWVFSAILSLAVLSIAPLHADNPKAAKPISTITQPAVLERTELYFGAVDEDDWEDFMARVVTPRFPDGLTWFDVHGQWRTPSGEIHRLPSRMLILLYKPSEANSARVDEVRALFKQRFHQISVLRASGPVTASF